MLRSRAFLLAPLAVALVASACSLLNAPGKEVPGGAGGGGGCDCSALDDPCNVGVCKAGACEKQPKDDGTSCDDGDFCTDGDSCHAGRCIGGDPHKCADKDACHPGSCDHQQQKCITSAAPDGAGCDDGDPCTGDGTCMGGNCQKGASLCNMPPFTTHCSIGTCVQGVGCKGVKDPTTDGDPCTDQIAPECATGQCVNGMCKPTIITNPDGSTSDGNPCASGKFCTVGTSCQGGECTGGAKRVCPTTDVCLTPECDEVSDQCSLKKVADDTPCDDGTGCNQGTTCKNGTCGHPTHTINNCGPMDGCCPGGGATCSATDDPDCFYWKSGVQVSVDDSKLLGWGTPCYVDTYPADSANDLTTIAYSFCGGGAGKVLVGCRQTGSSTIQVLAMADWTQVFDECNDPLNLASSTTVNGHPCIHNANGVTWYFQSGYDYNLGQNAESVFGFAPAGDDLTVDGFDCDYNQTQDGNRRFCSYTYGVALDVGQRCGNVFWPYDSYERVFYWSP